jgi:hypothetical protein
MVRTIGGERLGAMEGGARAADFGSKTRQFRPEYRPETGEFWRFL